MDILKQYREAMAAYGAGRYEAAIALLRTLASQRANAIGLLAKFYIARSHYRLGVEHHRAQSFRKAALHFQAAMRMNPSSDGIAGYLADHHAGTRDYDTAARLYEARLGGDPGNVRVRVRLALALWKQGRAYDAQSVIREGLRIGSDSAELHYQHGVMLAADARLSEAEATFQQAVAYDAGHARALERLAQCSAATGRHERASDYLARAHHADPHNARIAWQFSLLSARNDVYALRAKWPVADRQDHPESLERLSEILVADPEFVEAFLDLPGGELDSEVFSTLAATFERALRDHPEYADLQYHCGQVYHRLGLDSDAIRHVEQAVAVNPRYVNALILLGELYTRTDHRTAAVERLRQAVDAGGDYPDVHYLLGSLYEAEGETKQARNAYHRALELNSDYADARKALAQTAS